MFLSPENDRWLRGKHCKLGLCPGLLNRLYEQYLPLRRLRAPFLKGSQGSACTLARETLQWDRLVCTPKDRPWTVAQIRCSLQLCCVSCRVPPAMRVALDIIWRCTGDGGSFSSGLPLRDRQVELKLWRANVWRNSITYSAVKLLKTWAGRSIKSRSYEVWSQIYQSSRQIKSSSLINMLVPFLLTYINTCLMTVKLCLINRWIKHPIFLYGSICKTHLLVGTKSSTINSAMHKCLHKLYMISSSGCTV